MAVAGVDYEGGISFIFGNISIRQHNRNCADIFWFIGVVTVASFYVCYIVTNVVIASLPRPRRVLSCRFSCHGVSFTDFELKIETGDSVDAEKGSLDQLFPGVAVSSLVWSVGRCPVTTDASLG